MLEEGVRVRLLLRMLRFSVLLLRVRVLLELRVRVLLCRVLRCGGRVQVRRVALLHIRRRAAEHRARRVSVPREFCRAVRLGAVVARRDVVFPSAAVFVFSDGRGSQRRARGGGGRVAHAGGAKRGEERAEVPCSSCCVGGHGHCVVDHGRRRARARPARRCVGGAWRRPAWRRAVRRLRGRACRSVKGAGLRESIGTSLRKRLSTDWGHTCWAWSQACVAS
ncbi:hypothetical protein M885DRAFT_539997 [Pelagophyceae sp. CCMP2097]|nr:hypothetical protein M885DRAFT_539997 [Pelagophyceae sp. CCMP2097]